VQSGTLASAPEGFETPDISEELMAERPTLNTLRLRAALSMNELAVQAHVSASTIMEIERGAQPHMATMRKIAAVLGVRPQDIAWPGDPFGKLDQAEEPQE